MAPPALHEARLDVRVERDLRLTVTPKAPTVGPGGEVRHCGKVARAGEVVAVWVECVTDQDEDGDESRRAFVYLERPGGRITELPDGRFTGLGDFGLARAFAARLAEALKVPLNDTPV